MTRVVIHTMFLQRIQQGQRLLQSIVLGFFQSRCGIFDGSIRPVQGVLIDGLVLLNVVAGFHGGLLDGL